MSGWVALIDGKMHDPRAMQSRRQCLVKDQRLLVGEASAAHTICDRELRLKCVESETNPSTQRRTIAPCHKIAPDCVVRGQSNRASGVTHPSALFLPRVRARARDLSRLSLSIFLIFLDVTRLTTEALARISHLAGLAHALCSDGRRPNSPNGDIPIDVVCAVACRTDARPCAQRTAPD
jgi:hypothetical protein